ncbi:MAG: TetR/AcrR family transcriptional regulator [Mycobacterium sp.]
MAKPVAQRGTARGRVIDAALSLFAEHGVHATSLQMIADELVVTKAAVYYQFQSKDDIVMAVVRPIFDDIARVVRIASALASPVSQRDTAVSGIVELSVVHRRVMAVFNGDPVVHTLIKANEEFTRVVDELAEMLIGEQHDMSSRVTASMTTAGIFGSATDPRLADISDEDLRRTLFDCSQQLLKSQLLPPS